MSDIKILTLAYQRKDAGDNRDLSAIIAEIRDDLAAMQPAAPGPSDVVGFKSETIGGVTKEYNILGDGSMVEV